MLPLASAALTEEELLMTIMIPIIGVLFIICIILASILCCVRCPNSCCCKNSAGCGHNCGGGCAGGCGNGCAGGCGNSGAGGCGNGCGAKSYNDSDSDKFNLSKRTVKTKNVSKNLDSTVYKNESAIVFNEPSSAVQSSFVNESFQTEKGELQSKTIVYSGMNYTDSNAIEKQINSAKNETRNVTSSQTKYFINTTNQKPSRAIMVEPSQFGETASIATHLPYSVNNRVPQYSDSRAII